MQTTSTTRPFGISGTMRNASMTMGLALLFLTTTHPRAQQQLPPGTAGTAHSGWWARHATVNVDRTANGVRGTVVICSVDGLGGWWCVNTYASTNCFPLAMSAAAQPLAEAVTEKCRFWRPGPSPRDAERRFGVPQPAGPGGADPGRTR